MSLPKPGDIYRSSDDGAIYKVISVLDEPSFELEQIYPESDMGSGPLKREGAVRCQNMRDLKRLVEDTP